MQYFCHPYSFASVGRYFLPFISNLATIRPIIDLHTEDEGPTQNELMPDAKMLIMGNDNGDFVFNIHKFGATSAAQIIDIDISKVRTIEAFWTIFVFVFTLDSPFFIDSDRRKNRNLRRIFTKARAICT